MEQITKPQLAKIKTLMSKAGLLHYSEDITLSFSDGRTPRTSQLMKHEAVELIKHLEGSNTTASDSFIKMQRRILSMAHEAGLELANGKIDMVAVNSWCVKYGHAHKKFNAYTTDELPNLIYQFEQYYKHHLSKQ